MPPAVIPAVAAGAISAATGATVFGLGVAGTAFLIGGTTLALGAVQQALAPKPPDFGAGDITDTGITQQVRQAITAWRVLYGEWRISGPFTFIESVNDNAELHYVITHCSHPCAKVLGYLVNDVPVWPEQLDGTGLVTSGRFANKLRLQTDLGTTGAQPFPDLVSATTGWTDAHRQEGHTKTHVHLIYDRDVFPTRIPQVSVLLRGKNDIGDPRTAGTGYTANAALCSRDYLLDTKRGLGAKSTEVDDTAAQTAANECDELVARDTTLAENTDTFTSSEVSAANDTIDLDLVVHTGDRLDFTTDGTLPGGLVAATNYFAIVVRPRLAGDNPARIQLAASLDDAYAETAIDITSGGSGTHTAVVNAEPRYTVNGVIDTSRELGDVIRDMLTAMGARLPNIGGKWTILPAAFRTPTIAYDESDLRAGIRAATKISRRDRFNAVKGLFVAPQNNYQPTDYPPVTNAAYEAEDNGERIWKRGDHHLPFTNRPQTAKRLAKIELERVRRQKTVQAPFMLTGLRSQAGDVIQLTNERWGWTDKELEVVDWRLVPVRDGDTVYLGTEHSLRETDAAVFDFNEANEEVQIPPAPPTKAPSFETVAKPTGLSVGTEKFLTFTGDFVFRLVLIWDEPTNPQVRDVGRTEIQFKKSTSSTWRPSWFVEGNQIDSTVDGVEKGLDYDVRIRHINFVGVRSAWTPVTGVTVVSGSEIINIDDGLFGDGDEALDYGLFSGAVSENLDFALFGDAVTETKDYGAFS